MAAINDGGSAFPQVDTHTEGSDGDYRQVTDSYGGMTLRDYFAAKAMQAIIAKSPFGHLDGSEIEDLHRYTSRGAYVYADAMLKARAE